MIGVIFQADEARVVQEFFELFKTPWEKWNPDKRYDVVICATGRPPESIRADLVLHYSADPVASDAGEVPDECGGNHPRVIGYQDYAIPLYGECLRIRGGERSLLWDKESGLAVASREAGQSGETLLRVGYDLFKEIYFLLSIGQPAENAGIPTLELHIAFLRDQIRAAGIAFVEVPPVPQGYRFIACLTHDVDHPMLRRHCWDHTAGGFLYRATIGSFAKFLRGRSSLRTLLRNWLAATKWPLIQIGLLRDFWADFHRQYQAIEPGLPSTYFVLPFQGRCGRTKNGSMSKRRAAAYGVADIEPIIQNILSDGGEIALHGIDAWLDREAGRQELETIRSVTRQSDLGARMHWLCHDEHSPVELEEAGILYDSTSGYRETVGYRAGTTQAFVPPAAKSLIELPLHIMDTALFYPSYLGLNEGEADKVLAEMVKNAERFGGCLTVNWHDRSLAPERLWGSNYQTLVHQLQESKAWFATAGDVVRWFRIRRSVSFSSDAKNRVQASAGITAVDDRGLPPVQVLEYPSSGREAESPVPATEEC